MITAELSMNSNSSIYVISIKIEDEFILDKTQLDDLLGEYLLNWQAQINTVLKTKQLNTSKVQIDKALETLPNTTKLELPEIDIRVIFNRCKIMLAPNEFKLSYLRNFIDEIKCKRLNSRACFFFDSEVYLMTIDDTFKLYFVRSNIYQTFIMSPRTYITVRESSVDLLGYFSLSQKTDMRYTRFPIVVYSGSIENVMHSIEFRRDSLLLQEGVKIYAFRIDESLLYSNPDISITVEGESEIEYTCIPFELSKFIHVPKNTTVQYEVTNNQQIIRNSVNSRSGNFCYVYGNLMEDYIHVPLAYLWGKSFKFVRDVFYEGKLKPEIFLLDSNEENGVKMFS